LLATYANTRKLMNVRHLTPKLIPRHTNPPLIQGNLYLGCDNYGVIHPNTHPHMYSPRTGYSAVFINCSTGESTVPSSWQCYYQDVTNKYELQEIK
jgi:hypothetical protein